MKTKNFGSEGLNVMGGFIICAVLLFVMLVCGCSYTLTEKEATELSLKLKNMDDETLLIYYYEIEKSINSAEITLQDSGFIRRNPLIGMSLRQSLSKNREIYILIKMELHKRNLKPF